MLLVALLGIQPLPAQDNPANNQPAVNSGIPSGVMTAAATILDSQGRPWGYVLLSSTQEGTLRGKSFSVHIKPAAALAAGEFSPQGLIAPVSTPAAATALIDRAVRLGQARMEIEAAIRFLYRKTVHPNYLSRLHDPRQPGDPPWPDDPPQAGEPPLGEQAVLVETRAALDPNLARDLDVISLVSPGLALLHGRAWAGPLPVAGQTVTMEVRLRESGTDGTVAGRVELQAGVPLKLPAPGAPVQVPDRTNAGHLAIGLRWASPENLRRLSLLGHGFRIYRVDSTLAQEAGIITARPPIDVLEGLVSQMPGRAIRLSNALILPPKIFTEENAANFTLTPQGDPTTTFHVDRNERCCGQVSPGPFSEHSSFYYYVVACDLLGQPGEVSMGGPGQACPTIPPLPPPSAQAKADGTDTAFKVRVRWNHDPNRSFKSPPTHYEILRGVGSPTGNQTADPRISVVNKINSGADLERQNPALLTPIQILAAPAPPTGPPLPPATTHPEMAMEWTDPTPFIQPGETCWYAVRAVHDKRLAPPQTDSGCGKLYSDPTAASYVSRRRTDAPAPPALCYQGTSFPFAVVKFMAPVATETQSYPASEYRGHFLCRRENEGITHVRFVLTAEGNSNAIWEQTVYFADTKGQPGNSIADVRFSATGPVPGKPRLSCTAWSTTGVVSRTAFADFDFVNVPTTTRTKTTLPKLEFLAGAYSLNSLPAANSPLRSSVVSGSPSSTNATAVAGQGISMATITAPVSPSSLPGEDPTPSVMLEKLVNGAWVPAGGSRVLNQTVVLAGEFNGQIRATPLIVAAQAGCAGNVHQRDTADGTSIPVSLGLCLSSANGPAAEEYRVYRQVDHGELTLISQGQAADQVNGMMVIGDASLPISSAQVQYFAQLVDRNGNASPMAQLLPCPLKLAAPLPVPVLNKVRPAVTADLSPGMKVEWYCASPGVERFQIFVESKRSGSNLIRPIPNSILGVLSAGQDPAPPAGGSFILGPVPINVHHTLTAGALFPGVEPVVNTRSYYTRRLGKGEANLGIGPDYSLTLPVTGAGKYKVWVKAIGPTGGVSAPSNLQEFVWTRPLPEIPALEDRPPWPARPLPLAIRGDAFTVPAAVVRIPATGLRVDSRETLWPDNTGEKYLRGVVIGQTPVFGQKSYFYNTNPRSFALSEEEQLRGRSNPNSWLSGVIGRAGDRILPAVLYRRQIAGPDPAFPGPPGDVIQVSPLIEHIAHYRSGESSNVIIDPYVAVLGHFISTSHDPQQVTFAILDHQPVIEGAAYQYFLVRFDAVGEMVDVIEAGTTLIE
ncbi:MAG: hypothetical protein JWL81_2602 [Verrucomicrobiales bacterium]|nr:hypothetical protein [Verrucomicrobiales bacterium]